VIRTTAGEAGQAGIDLDVAMDEPVFVFAASDPVAAELLTCYEMLLKDVPDSQKHRREVRRWQGAVVSYRP
jgi:hypothetical protein